jgi:hypothetical protein
MKDLPPEAADVVRRAFDSTRQRDKGDIEFLTKLVKNIPVLTPDFVQLPDDTMLFSRLAGRTILTRMHNYRRRSEPGPFHA